MKTLLTGADGLVGSTISADIRISGKSQVDLRRWLETRNFFMKHKPETVIHTAGRVGGLGANMNHMADFFRDNILINTNVLDAAKECGAKRVVSFLSTCIFPAEVEYPLTEDKLHQGEPHESNFGYAYAKRMLEVHSRALKVQHGMDCICVVPTNIYGPRDNFNLESGHVVPALIHKCYLAKKNNTDLVIWGSGDPLREFIYSEDVGEVTQLICEHYQGPEPLIISNSEEVTIRQLVESIVKAVGFEGKVVYDRSKPDGQYRKPTSNNLLRKTFPDYKFTPLDVGIQKTVDWFVENYEECRR